MYIYMVYTLNRMCAVQYAQYVCLERRHLCVLSLYYIMYACLYSMCVCVFVYVCVCICVCVFVCVCVCVWCVCVCVCLRVCVPTPEATNN